MEEVPLKPAHGAVDHGYRIDESLPPNHVGLEEPQHSSQVKVAVANPGPHELVLEPHARRDCRHVRLRGDREHLVAKSVGDDLVGIAVIHPGMLERDV